MDPIFILLGALPAFAGVAGAQSKWPKKTISRDRILAEFLARPSRSDSMYLPVPFFKLILDKQIRLVY